MQSFVVTAGITNSLEKWFLAQIEIKCENDGQAEYSLNELTVLIPSYCRQAFLLRQIIYWMQKPVKVILLDGSPNPLPPLLQSSIQKIPRITYLHNPVSPLERLAGVKDLITTPYAVMLGDDEFHLFSGLRRAIQYLQTNEDFIGCIGQSIRFYVSNQASRVIYGSGYRHFRYNANSESARERFAYAMEDYNAATCYAVMRTQVWLDSWGSLTITSCKDTCEIQQALATYAAGKLSTVDQIYWLRSDENVSVPDKQHSRISFAKWWLSAAYEHERRQIVAAVARVMEKYKNVPRTLAESSAQAGWEMYFKFYERNYPPQKLFTWSRLKGVVVDVLQLLLPEQLYSTLKNRLISNRRPASESIQADLGLREQLAQAMSPTLFLYDDDTNNDLCEVESLLLDFYAHK